MRGCAHAYGNPLYVMQPFTHRPTQAGAQTRLSSNNPKVLCEGKHPLSVNFVIAGILWLYDYISEFAFPLMVTLNFTSAKLRI